jgi:hypothetical protein
VPPTSPPISLLVKYLSYTVNIFTFPHRVFLTRTESKKLRFFLIHAILNARGLVFYISTLLDILLMYMQTFRDTNGNTACLTSWLQKSERIQCAATKQLNTFYLTYNIIFEHDIISVSSSVYNFNSFAASTSMWLITAVFHGSFVFHCVDIRSGYLIKRVNC